MTHISKVGIVAASLMGAAQGLTAGVALRNRYEVECHDSAGVLLWREDIYNLVTTEGLNDLLSKYLKGATYTAAFFVGLIDNASFGALGATDTAARIVAAGSINSPTTNNWGESQAYSESLRQTLTLGSASAGSIDNSASKAVFTMNATKTINGIFIATLSTKGGTTGVLYGEASFGTAQPVISGNTITVTVTLTAATA